RWPTGSSPEGYSVPYPPVLTNVSVYADGTLMWTAKNADSVEYDVYRVAVPFPGLQPVSEWGERINSAPITATTFTDNATLPSGTYRYKVVARDASGEVASREASTPRYVIGLSTN